MSKRIVVLLGLIAVLGAVFCWNARAESNAPMTVQGLTNALTVKLGAPCDIVFTSKVDGTPQRYVRMLPEPFDNTQPHMLMVALHGHGSDRWQYVRAGEQGEMKGARTVAVKYNMIYVSPDYRATTSWMGPSAEADVVQILEDLRREFKITKVIFVGASMGGTSVLTFAALHPDLVDGVSSQNGLANHFEYGNFQDAISKSFGGRKDQVPLEYKNRSAEYWPERLTMPVAITAGGQDLSVPPQSVLRLANVLKALKRDVLVIYREKVGHKTDYADTLAALEFVMQRVTNTSRPAGLP